jgi:hypothetical protein
MVVVVVCTLNKKHPINFWVFLYSTFSLIGRDLEKNPGVNFFLGKIVYINYQ